MDYTLESLLRPIDCMHEDCRSVSDLNSALGLPDNSCTPVMYCRFNNAHCNQRLLLIRYIRQPFYVLLSLSSLSQQYVVALSSSGASFMDSYILDSVLNQVSCTLADQAFISLL